MKREKTTKRKRKLLLTHFLSKHLTQDEYSKRQVEACTKLYQQKGLHTPISFLMNSNFVLSKGFVNISAS